jgi:hypothetical protein
MFGLPVDSEIIKNINPAQMAWYAYMINRDREDEFDKKLNMTEYLASFINPHAIQQLRDMRDKQKIVPEQEFGQQLRDMFGRDLTPEAIESGTRAETIVAENISQEKKKPGSITIDDIKKYANLPDDIKFYPKKR